MVVLKLAGLILFVLPVVRCGTNCNDCRGHDVSIGNGITVTNIIPTGFSPESPYDTTDFLSTTPSTVFGVPTGSACVNIDMTFGRSVSAIDICEVDVTTKFISKVTFTCGAISEQQNIVGNNLAFTKFNLHPPGDNSCEPNAAATCFLCIETPSHEGIMGGFNISGCDCCIDCVVGQWSQWSNCSVHCGYGIRTRSRQVIVPPNDCGASCPNLVETDICHMPCCPDSDKYPIDCSKNKQKIISVAITSGTPPTEKVYTQNAWKAIRGCNGQLILSKNSAGQNGYQIKTVSTDVYNLCISWKLSPKVTVQLWSGTTSVDIRSETFAAACPGCPSTAFASYCFKYSDLSEFGAQGVTKIDFSFDPGSSNEWIIKNIYIIACPPP